MKLSYRDKVIFICAIVVIILVAGIFLFIKPKFTEMNSAKVLLESKQTEKEELEAKINTFPQLVETLKASAEEVDELQSYFIIEQDPYLNEQLIHDLLDDNNVDVLGINTEYATADDLEEYIVVPSNVNAYDLLMSGDLYNELPQEVYDVYNEMVITKGDVITIGVTEMTITYRDSYDIGKELKFADTIADYGKTVNIVDITKTDRGDAETDEYDGMLTLKIYSIYPLNVEKIMEESNEIEIVPIEETAVTDETASDEAA